MSDEFWILYWRAFDKVVKAEISAAGYSSSWSENDRKKDNLFFAVAAFDKLTERLTRRPV